MILESLKLRNFRQFYGETPVLHFAKGERNVTVLHGANGAGKTTLLNAFTWALYGEFSRGFQLSDELVNKRAIREASLGETVEATVDLTFSYGQRRYSLQRRVEVQRAENPKGWSPVGKAKAVLQCRDVDGATREITDIEDTIGRILPADLHWYFFFDGERIERLVQADRDRDDKRDIAAASKKLLGVEVLNRASENHLPSAKQELEQELRRIGDAETRKLLEEKAGLEESCLQANKRRTELQTNIDGHQERRKLLKARLRGKHEVKEVQLKREKLEQDVSHFREAIKRSKQDLQTAVRDDGFVVLMTRTAEKFHQLFSELRKRGELPAGIKRQFVQDIIDRGMCICNTKLEEGSSATQAVRQWLARAGLADVEEKTIRMSGELSTFPERIASFWRRADNIKSDMLVNTEKLARTERELEKIREFLRDQSAEEVSNLERQLEETEALIDRDTQEIGLKTGMIAQYEAEISNLDRKITQHRALESRQRTAQRRVDAANEAIKRIREVRGLFEQELRFKLQQRVREAFRKISFTPYLPQVEEDFSLSLIESAGGAPLPVAASTGESQVLSISFIGSLIQLTKEYQCKKERLPGPDDVQFPIVMDSPFGSLDQHHREQVAIGIPSLADQIVVMVSKSQWQGAVENSISDHIGKHYVLTYFSPRDDLAADSVVIDGHGYEIVKQSPNDFEYTEIREVNHA